MESVQIRVSGRVQGVGFRFALRDEARALGIKGWVRNRADGSVEALLQGHREALEALVRWARHGPRAAQVEHVEERAPEPEFACPYDDFKILPSA
jgi:acylphosphatase